MAPAGGAMLGYWLIGSLRIDRPPASTTSVPRAFAAASAAGKRFAVIFDLPVTFSMIASHPVHHMLLIAASEPECPHRLEDVAYAQVRRRTVKIRANF